MAQRLLLADDSITIQKVIELTFADEKIDVVAVSDGEQAIARLVSEPFDIVLADVGMPVKDGFDVAAFVKGHPTLGHLPVILLTGAFESVDDAKVSAVGAAGGSRQAVRAPGARFACPRPAESGKGRRATGRSDRSPPGRTAAGRDRHRGVVC